jgi:hypothetical protein
MSTFPGADAGGLPRLPDGVGQLFLDHCGLPAKDPHEGISDELGLGGGVVAKQEAIGGAPHLYDQPIGLALGTDQTVSEADLRRTKPNLHQNNPSTLTDETEHDLRRSAPPAEPAATPGLHPISHVIGGSSGLAHQTSVEAAAGTLRMA